MLPRAAHTRLPPPLTAHAPLPPQHAQHAHTPTRISPSPQGVAKILSNEEDLDSQEGDGMAFKDLKVKDQNIEEYVCPKLHRGGAAKASSGRSARCAAHL